MRVKRVNTEVPANALRLGTRGPEAVSGEAVGCGAMRCCYWPRNENKNNVNEGVNLKFKISTIFLLQDEQKSSL